MQNQKSQISRETIHQQLVNLEEDDRWEQLHRFSKEIYLKGGQLLEFKLTTRLSFLTNKPIHALDLPPGTLIVAILRGDELLIPKGDYVLHLGDSIFLLGHLRTIDQIKAWNSQP